MQGSLWVKPGFAVNPDVPLVRFYSHVQGFLGELGDRLAPMAGTRQVPLGPGFPAGPQLKVDPRSRLLSPGGTPGPPKPRQLLHGGLRLGPLQFVTEEFLHCIFFLVIVITVTEHLGVYAFMLSGVL